MDKTHQRVGAKSNAHVGREFELATQNFFASQDLDLALKLQHKLQRALLLRAQTFSQIFLLKKRVR